MPTIEAKEPTFAPAGPADAYAVITALAVLVFV